jgi:hypothetical protein
LIKFRRRVGQPVIVNDLNNPACLEKSTRLGDGGRGATVSIVSPSFEARIVKGIQKIHQQ